MLYCSVLMVDGGWDVNRHVIVDRMAVAVHTRKDYVHVNPDF